MVIYEVTETDVNGCGDNATEYVAFGKNENLSEEEEEIFQTALDQARIKGDEECWDTTDRVEAAAETFAEKTGILCWVTNSPYAGSFEF